MRADPARASIAPPRHDQSGSPLTEPDWRAAIALRWQALGLDVLGIGSGPRRKPSELGNECQALAILTALFECDGNLTHAAARLGTSRRACRERLTAWVRRNPHFAPPLPEWQPEVGKLRRRRVKPEGPGPEVGVLATKAGEQGAEIKGEP